MNIKKGYNENSRKSFLGKKHTEESKRKISEKQKGNKYCLGRKLSKETKMKISKKMSGKLKLNFRKENHPNWLNGKSFELYGTDWTDDLRESIRKRDNYICQNCGVHQDELDGFYKSLDCHHIDYNKLNLNPDNLISLCRSCHIKTNFNREYWIKYFFK